MDSLLHTVDIILKIVGGFSAVALFVRILTAVVVLVRETLQTHKTYLEIREIQRKQRDAAIEASGIVTAVENFQEQSMEEKRRRIREALLKGKPVRVGGDSENIVVPRGKLAGGVVMAAVPSLLARWLQLDRESQTTAKVYLRFDLTDLLLTLIAVIAMAALAFVGRAVSRG